MNRFSLQDQHAVITGGSRGIGLAIARGFLQNGATVTISSRRDDNVQQAVSELQEFADRIAGCTAHVGRADERQMLLETAKQNFGPIQILVNNAGTNPYFGPLVESDDAAWDKTFDVNLKGPYALSRDVAREMIPNGAGSILNIASVAGLAASPGQGIYSVSKAGLIMLTKVMARELGPHGIRVNCICPGLVKTRLAEALWKNPDLERAITSQKALQRSAEPDEIVGAALYLASSAASFTTGAVLQVDGGMVI